jgi:uncharacterized protein YrrD
MNALHSFLRANAMIGFQVRSSEISLGRIEDFRFDDQSWFINKVVIATGGWPYEHRVLVSPHELLGAEWRKKRIIMHATEEEIKESPEAIPESPWFLFGANDVYFSSALWPEIGWGLPVLKNRSASDTKPIEGENRLLSTRSLKGAEVQTEDEKVSSWADDFLFDPQTWRIKYLLVKTIEGTTFVTDVQTIQSIRPDEMLINVHGTTFNSEEWIEYDPHYMMAMCV